LVESLKYFCPNLQTDIHVLYTADRKEFNYGYDKFAKLNPDVKMEYEACFESDFTYYLQQNINEHVMLLTDDCVFYNQFLGNELDVKIAMIESAWCFSFRLGLNTTTQWYRTGSQQDHLNILGYNTMTTSRGEDFIRWNWKIRPAFENYGYMMSWDGHVYRAKDLAALSKQFSFYNPRTFEDRATKNPENRALITKKYMVAPAISCLFVNTINAVQEEPPPFGEKYHMSPEELNERYLGGEVIDIATFEGLELTGSHDEIPLQFRKV
jgi:hypothetical protein